MSTEPKCPFAAVHGKNVTASSRGNRDWWPNQLNLAILHQHAPASNPLGSGFDYADEFQKLMTKGRVRYLFKGRTILPMCKSLTALFSLGFLGVLAKPS